MAPRLAAVSSTMCMAVTAGEQVAWRTGMVRPASSARQLKDFWKAAGGQGAAAAAGSDASGPGQAACLSLQQAQQLVPGLQVPAL
jgi:hypothetical protein